MTRDSYEKGKGALETRDRYGKDIEKVRDKMFGFDTSKV